MSGRIFFDANVLVYLFDQDSPAKQARARELFEREARDGRIVLSPQILQEFYVTVVRKLARPLPAKEALAAVRSFAKFPLVPVDGAIILRAIELHQRHTLSFWDALVIQAALEGGCNTLWSEDLQEGRSFGELRIGSPFT